MASRFKLYLCMCGNSLDGLYFIIISDRYVLLTVFRYLKLYKPESLPSSSELEASSSRSLWFFRILVAARLLAQRLHLAARTTRQHGGHRRWHVLVRRCRCCARAHGAAAKRSHPSHTPSALLFALFPYTPPYSLPFPPLTLLPFLPEVREFITRHTAYNKHDSRHGVGEGRAIRRPHYPTVLLVCECTCSFS